MHVVTHSCLPNLAKADDIVMARFESGRNRYTCFSSERYPVVPYGSRQWRQASGQAPEKLWLGRCQRRSGCESKRITS
jgi:hypothetical protein